MPKYEYLRLTVKCLEPRDFAVTELRAAVEYLREVVTQVSRPFVGVVADAGILPAGMFKLDGKVMLTLDEIEGRTPAEVWAAFDAKLDDEIEYLTRRGEPSRPRTI